MIFTLDGFSQVFMWPVKVREGTNYLLRFFVNNAKFAPIEGPRQLFIAKNFVLHISE